MRNIFHNLQRRGLLLQAAIILILTAAVVLSRLF